MFPEMFPMLLAPRSLFAESPSPSDRLIKACTDADLSTLKYLLQFHRDSIKSTDKDKAWRMCVDRMDEGMCKAFIDHFGCQFINDSKALRNACADDKRPQALFLLSLINGQPMIDEGALEMASQQGHTEFVMGVLNDWIINTYVDLTWMCISAMLGSIYGDHEELFGLVLSKFKEHTTWGSQVQEFKGIHSNIYLNRKVLMMIASRSNPKYFLKALEELDTGFNTPSGDDKYTAITRIRGYNQVGHARLTLFSVCCDLKDSRMIDALIEKFGNNLFMNFKPVVDSAIISKYFNTALANNHASVVKLLIQRSDLEAALPMFKVCVNENRTDFCQAFVDVFGSAIVSIIEADSELHTNPTIRSLLCKYFKSKYELYC